MLRVTACLIILMPLSSVVAQQVDPAEQRAAIANQRIEAEMQRQKAIEEARKAEEARLAELERAAEQARAREAAARAEAQQAETPVRATRPAPPRPPATGGSSDPAEVQQAVAPVRETRPAPPRPPAKSQPGEMTTSDMASAMEQIRQLGEMRDAGYLTKKEFERLKKKVLDDLL